MAISRRVLVADDDRDLRACVCDLLGDWPLEIIQAETGSAALEILRGEPLLLALLDMHMPGYTGLELVSLVRRETLGVPCIVLSGDATEALRSMAMHEGALAVFRKPPEPALLRAEISRVLRLSDGLDRPLH
ncbi:MAG: response regulator [Planctomycetes bacterium]|nr:response regulator [Planctomycetota bacterium]